MYALFFLLFTCWVAPSKAYTFEIMIHHYSNPRHLSIGQKSFRFGCCEGNRALPCDPCDNAFRVCVREDVIGEEHDGCDIGVLETGLIALDNDTLPFSAGDSIGELTNPLMFSGEAWPGMVEIVFTIYDLDGTAAIDRTSDLVDNILIAPSINAVPFQNSSFTPTMSYNGTHSVVSLSFRLVCGSNAYGPNCVQCVDRDDEFGHFVCDTATGDKLCLEGYTNSLSNCIDCALAEGCDPLGGYCTKPRECLCKQGFEGSNCSSAKHPCYREPCLNGGDCLNATDDPSDFKCECMKGFLGRTCAEVDHCIEHPCDSLHGTCKNMELNYICECDLDFTGQRCETMIDDCESVNCSGRGECMDRVRSFSCNCDQGYEGLLCEKVASSDSQTGGGNAVLAGVVVVVGGVLTLLISIVLIAICALLCRGRKLKRPDEVGVPNPYEAPAAFSKLHGRDTTNGIEKNFNNPLYQEGSISPTSPPLPPRPEHPYAMLEEVNGPYDQISNPPLPTEGSPNLKCEELSETPYLDPKGASTYAHIPGDFVPPENSLPTLDLPASEEALGPEMANPYDHIASNSANGVLPELSPAQDLSASAPKQDTETPYLDPVNAMNSSTSIYAHIS